MAEYRMQSHGRVDEARPLSFSFDGVTYSAFEGDTLASGLLANGIHLMGRSFKYHRPRGVVSAGSEEPNALVTFDRGEGRVTSNVRATTLELFDGLVARSQNRWPSLKTDVGAFNNIFSIFFPAGFYNKTFMWPKSFWDKVYEPFIRNLAGLGPAPTGPDADSYSSAYRHCETLIVGAGPAGLAAALEAAKTGERVIIVDEQAEFGGALLSTPSVKIDDVDAWIWLERTLETLRSSPNVTMMTRTTAIGYYHDNFVGLVQRLTDHLEDGNEGRCREALIRLRAGKVILAQGAIERPLVFNGNDRPGVMLASAAQTYLNRYGVAVGKKVAVFTSHDSAYDVVFDLHDADLDIAVIVDVREHVPAHLAAEVERRGIKLSAGSSITATRGKLKVKAVDVSKNSSTGSGKSNEVIDCDSLIMSGGWTPSLHLFSHSKGSIKWDKTLGAYIPNQANENSICVGACNGEFDLSAGLTDGSKAGGGNRIYRADDNYERTGLVFSALPKVRFNKKQMAFVDFQNDVTEKDVNLAVREGFRSIEHIKRYTTNGMATDQGKTSNLNALQIASEAVEKPVEKIGLTTFRPPFTPTTFGAMTGYRDGDLFEVTRKTPIDPWAVEHGAVFEPVGTWRRAWYFPKSGEDMHVAVARECKATRDSLGIFDASTLGKIEVVGPDATKFMNLLYTNPWSSLKPGGCRYGLMCRKDGYIYDDGVVARLADDRYHVTTTTGGAPRVFQHMEDYLQTEFAHLDVWLTSTTEHWAVIAINGPNARKLISPFVDGIDLSPSAFPHMAVREGKICGVPTRLFRVSFTGELGFEINVPAHYGRYVWEQLFQEGQQYDICPYGTETMHVLRAEKGFIIVGQDTDGTVTPHDAGMSWAVSKKKKDFVGKRSLARPDLMAPGRKQLIGLLTEDPNLVLEEGAQIIADPNQSIPMKMIGHVTSSYWSEPLGRSIAMALVYDGFNLVNETLHVPMPSETHKARVVKPMFIDPKGGKLNAV
jgi:sarcosine oxidase subunit alpha